MLDSGGANIRYSHYHREGSKTPLLEILCLKRVEEMEKIERC
jgi:hypothetical protein